MCWTKNSPRLWPIWAIAADDAGGSEAFAVAGVFGAEFECEAVVVRVDEIMAGDVADLPADSVEWHDQKQCR